MFLKVNLSRQAASDYSAHVDGLGVIILGAGASSRMGRPKLLLPWGETTILSHLLQQWASLGAGQITVVLSHPASPVTSELDRLSFPAANRISNPNPDRGMFSSIQSAAQWTYWKATLTHWAIVLGDQPHLKHETLQRFLSFAAGHADKVSQPSRCGRPRHPVIMPKSAFTALASSSAPNLKDFLRERMDGVALMEVDDPEFDLDIDRPEDYEAAIRMFSRQA